MTSPKAARDWFPGALPSTFRIGERSWLYSSLAFLHFDGTGSATVAVGNNSGVYDGTFFDVSDTAQIDIGDYCTIVGAIFATRGRITIGNYVFISHEVVLADNPFAYPRQDFLSEPLGESTIVIEDDVWIGAQAIVTGGVRIGQGSIIGAAALVDRDVPPNSIFAGNPGRIIGEIQPAADSSAP
jgi:acetyltransferase-like isoleucine patch superfamily enzyme